MVLARFEAAGRLRIGTAAQAEDAVTRAHLSDGRVVGWYGGPGIVIDAELSDQAIPQALARRFGRDRFWARWTQAECAAKLADVPILLWLREHGLGRGPFPCATLDIEGVTVSLACAM